MNTRESECSGKKVYMSFTEAQRACRKVENDPNDDRRLTPYRCHYCHNWHCGNRAIPPNKRDDDDRKRWKNWNPWRED